MRSAIKLVCAIGAITSATAVSRATPTKYLFSFGDSYTRTSFDIDGTQPSAENPMGNPALGQGTASNGTNYIGYLTTALNRSLVLSFDFADGGATITDSVVKTSPDIHSVEEQVKRYYEPKYSSKPKSIAPWDAKSGIFTVCVGINDLNLSYQKGTITEVIPKLMEAYFDLIENLYLSGARRFLILNVPPLDRSPLKSHADSHDKVYAEWINEYNRQLGQRVEAFNKSRPEVLTSLYDFHKFMGVILDNPMKYGFKDATCEGIGGPNCIWRGNFHTSPHFQKLLAEDLVSPLAKLDW